jgi:hypothetical protein
MKRYEKKGMKVLETIITPTTLTTTTTTTTTTITITTTTTSTTTPKTTTTTTTPTTPTITTSTTTTTPTTPTQPTPTPTPSPTATTTTTTTATTTADLVKSVISITAAKESTLTSLLSTNYGTVCLNNSIIGRYLMDKQHDLVRWLPLVDKIKGSTRDLVLKAHINGIYDAIVSKWNARENKSGSHPELTVLCNIFVPEQIWTDKLYSGTYSRGLLSSHFLLMDLSEEESAYALGAMTLL